LTAYRDLLVLLLAVFGKQQPFKEKVLNPPKKSTKTGRQKVSRTSALCHTTHHNTHMEDQSKSSGSTTEEVSGGSSSGSGSAARSQQQPPALPFKWKMNHKKSRSFSSDRVSSSFIRGSLGKKEVCLTIESGVCSIQGILFLITTSSPSLFCLFYFSPSPLSYHV